MARQFRPFRIVPTLLGLGALASLPAAARSNAGSVTSLNLAGYGEERVLSSAPSHPRGSIVMFPGGAGDIGLDRNGGITRGDNFVVRTRALWNMHGYAVLIPDTIDRANLRGVRSAPAYGQLADSLIALAHRQWPGPVFVLGTSQGSIAAMNGAAHAASGSVAGVVLTESVSVMGGSGETVFDADPQRVHVPVLIVANRDDHCRVAPPQDASRIAAALTASREVRVVMVSGGVTRSTQDCGSLTPHGYYGIEGKVVDAVTHWMDEHR
jgi:hypothetical protein